VAHELLRAASAILPTPGLINTEQLAFTRVWTRHARVRAPRQNGTAI